MNGKALLKLSCHEKLADFCNPGALFLMLELGNTELFQPSNGRERKLIKRKEL